MEKAISTIEEWLQDCNGIPENDQLNTSLENDQDRLIHSIFSLFDEKTRYPELFENTMKQLFVLARSKEEKIRDFVLLFVPSLIYIYLSAVSMGDKKSVSNIEITLVSLYNTEVLSEKGVAEVASFRLPTLARQSIYHEPASLAPTSFTTDSLHRLEAGDAETVRWGPPKHMTTVTAATRYHLATALLVAFNARLSKFPKIVLVHLCKATSKLVCQGFSRPGHHHRSSYGSDGNFGVYPRPVPRIPITSDLLAELVHAVYYAIPSRRSLHDLPTLVSLQMGLSQYHFNSHNDIGSCGTKPASSSVLESYSSPQVRFRRFNDFASLGIQTLEDVHLRAQYELFADVLLMTNAIKNSLKVSPCSQSNDGPMGISIALTPSTSAAPLSKTYITNASFRTKKLPDDLLEVTDDDFGATSPNSLPPSLEYREEGHFHRSRKGRIISDKEPPSHANKSGSPMLRSPPELFKMFYKGEGKNESNTSVLAVTPDVSPRDSIRDTDDGFLGVYPKTSMRSPTTKEGKTSLVSPKSSSPILESKIGMFLKSRIPFGPFHTLRTSPIKNPSSDDRENVNLTVGRHVRTHSDSASSRAVFLSSSTPSSPTATKRYISSNHYDIGEDDIPVQRLDGVQDGPKGLKSISEDQDGEDMTKPIRTPQGSGRDKSRLSANLPIPNLVKKRDKEKNRNGEKRDSEKRGEKERKSKQEKEKDKENRTDSYVNRNSVTLSSDMSLSSSVPDGLLKQTSPQQHIEMKVIPRIEDRIEEQLDGSTQQTKTTDVNGTPNQVGKVS